MTPEVPIESNINPDKQQLGETNVQPDESELLTSDSNIGSAALSGALQEQALESPAVSDNSTLGPEEAVRRSQEAKSAFPDNDKELKAEEFYLAMEYLNLTQDLEDDFARFGLPQVSDKALLDLEPYQPDAKYARKFKHSIITTKDSAAAAEALIGVILSGPKFLEFLSQLDSQPGAPAHLVVQEFLMMFKNDAVKRYKLLQAWNNHQQRVKQRQEMLAELKTAYAQKNIRTHKSAI